MCALHGAAALSLAFVAHCLFTLSRSCALLLLRCLLPHRVAWPSPTWPTLPRDPMASRLHRSIPETSRSNVSARRALDCLPAAEWLRCNGMTLPGAAIRISPFFPWSRVVCSLPGHRNEPAVFAVNSIQFHPKHGTFVTVGGDGVYTYWSERISAQKQRVGPLASQLWFPLFLTPRMSVCCLLVRVCVCVV